MSPHILKSMEDTTAAAKIIASRISAPFVIGLVGDLGAGKTTLVKSLVASLGGTTDVSSPTFVLQHIYHSQKGLVSHWDLYRLKSPPEELFEDLSGQGITVIEWVDKFPDIMSQCDLIISLKVGDMAADSVISRTLSFSGPKAAKFEYV